MDFKKKNIFAVSKKAKNYKSNDDNDLYSYKIDCLGLNGKYI